MKKQQLVKLRVDSVRTTGIKKKKVPNLYCIQIYLYHLRFAGATIAAARSEPLSRGSPRSMLSGCATPPSDSPPPVETPDSKYT